MNRTMVGFHPDEAGDWVAELDCLHNQHVRHRPPFQERPWTLTGEGRAARLGQELDCPLCDRAEPPEGLVVVRRAGPFDETSLPAGLRREHRVAAGVWGRLRVQDGRIRLFMSTTPPLERTLGPGEDQALPPAVTHRLHLIGPVRLEIEFLART
jgi:tellurite methyltransferase